MARSKASAPGALPAAINVRGAGITTCVTSTSTCALEDRGSRRRVEPTTGLHPLDLATPVGVFDRPLKAGATIIVIDHDLDLLAAADHLIDMGPGGGPDGGRILAAGTPEDVARTPGSVTGPWLAEHLGLPEARQHG